MPTITLATTSQKAPGSLKIAKDETIVVSSDKILVFPREDGASSLVMANGWEFEVDAEVAEIATALDSTDASSYT